MAVVKQNTYGATQGLSNLSLNVDYDRLGEDASRITVNFGTSPATVTVKVGSMFEINGARYLVETADSVFQLSNSAHPYITYNETTGFGSAATRGAWDDGKRGYYQADNVTRTLDWYINATLQIAERLPERDDRRYDIAPAYNAQQITSLGAGGGTRYTSAFKMHRPGLISVYWSGGVILQGCWLEIYVWGSWRFYAAGLYSPDGYTGTALEQAVYVFNVQPGTYRARVYGTAIATTTVNLETVYDDPSISSGNIYTVI